MQNIFLEKNHNPPFKLNGRSLINTSTSDNEEHESMTALATKKKKHVHA
jgi:hypothetical protein